MKCCVALAGWLLWTAVCAGAAGAQDVPEQFRVRGRRAAPHPYLGEPGLDVPGAVQVEATDAEMARGFVIFARPATDVVMPDYVPAAADRCDILQARDCPGQYGPITFCVLALRAGKFSVRVTDLVSAAGDRIGASNLDVRAVRYVGVTAGGEPQTIPLLIEAAESRRVAANRIQQFWMTYHVPEDAAPGLYEGQVQVLVDGDRRLALPLRLRVNPFRLVEPDVSIYIYYSPSTEPSEIDLIRKELIDQRCHGMNMGILAPPVTRDGDLSSEALAPFLDAYAGVGFARSSVCVGLWNRITSEWLNTPDRTIGMYCPWFRYYPFSRELDERYVRTVRMILDEARARGLELVLAVADEAGSHPWTIEAAQHYNDLLKREVPDVVRELTVGGGWAMGHPEHELWKGRIHIWSTNRWLPDRLALVRKDDPSAKIQLYNMAGKGSAPGGLQATRVFYGFFNWKARADGVAQWVYWHPSTPEHNYVWPAEDPDEGRVPTLRWEAAREGAKDRRYLATLEERLNGRTDEAAAAARRFLEEVAAQIELHTGDYDVIDGGRVPAHRPGTYDRWRDRIADFIKALSA